MIGAELKGRMAFVTMRFSPKLISSVKDASGQIVEGSDNVVDVTETWTFSRQLGSRDPNWLLVATESGA
jgi:predicted lipid-binding transport protein (Tim44 family)